MERASTRLQERQAESDAAIEDKAADPAALDAYSKLMEAQMRAYSALPEDQSEWVVRVEDPSSYVTYDEPYSVPSHAQWDRQAIRDELNGLVVLPRRDGRGTRTERVGAMSKVSLVRCGPESQGYCPDEAGRTSLVRGPCRVEAEPRRQKCVDPAADRRGRVHAGALRTSCVPWQELSIDITV